MRIDRLSGRGTVFRMIVVEAAAARAASGILE
jgi:hypothetical protein